MKTTRYQSSEERTILIALLVHDGVLAKVYRHMGQDHSRPFKSKWSNLIAKWCFDYFAKYQRAPRKAIEGIFSEFAQSSQDKESVDLVENFLSGLDEEYRSIAKSINEDYIVDKASEYFDRIRLARMSEAIGDALEKNDLEEAARAHSEYERIEFATTGWQDPLSLEFLKEVFTRKDDDERLVEFPDALGKFLSPYLKRNSFISFAGPSKRGKSFWLQEIVWRALKQRRRVLYYVLGDMSKDDVGHRLCMRMTRKPLQEAEVHIPVRLQTPESRDDSANVKLKTENRSGLTPRDIRLAREKFLATTGSKESRLHLKVEGGDVISASQIEQDMKQFGKLEQPPDLVVVDYADLLAPEPHTKNQDFRHQINATWKILRRIALRNHCLVVTATQTAATGYSAWIIRKKDFSEDRRKNDHVSGMIGINQTENEKEMGIYRLNWIALRNGKWSESQVVWTAGELAIACPCIISSF